MGILPIAAKNAVYMKSKAWYWEPSTCSQQSDTWFRPENRGFVFSDILPGINACNSSNFIQPCKILDLSTPPSMYLFHSPITYCREWILSVSILTTLGSLSLSFFFSISPCSCTTKEETEILHLHFLSNSFIWYGYFSSPLINFLSKGNNSTPFNLPLNVFLCS